MRLKNAAKFFDDTPVYDGYTGALLFNCQFSSFNDANAVGSTSTRRILSIAPGLTIPARRVIKVFDDRWIVGDGNPDSWNADVIRQSFNMKKATAYLEVLTPGQACLGTAGTFAYAQAQYFKDDTDTLRDSNYDTFWNVFLAPSEPTGKGTILKDGSRLLRSRGSYIPVEDLRILQCDELDVGPTTAVFDSGAYVPLTDSFSAGTVTAPVLWMDYLKAYRLQISSSPKEEPGDTAALVAQASLTPEVGKRLLLGGVRWVILALSAEQDAWLLHLRRA